MVKKLYNESKIGKEKLRTFLSGLFAISLLACSFAQVKAKFSSSLVDARTTDWLLCDLDGDKLKDLVLVDTLELSIFYQDSKRGFVNAEPRSYTLGDQPSLLSAVKLGRPYESLLLLTSEGVTELCFTNRAETGFSQAIIQQRTLMPPSAPNMQASAFTLAARAGSDWPLLLVPARDGLQVWKHEGEWRSQQVISNSVDSSVQPSLADPGYTTASQLNLNVADIDQDGREDLMFRRSNVGGSNTYTLYLQQTNGAFGSEPALSYADKIEDYSWICWVDLNRDRKIDLIKSIWLDEPSFLPGVSSGKVLVSAYLADPQGRIPLNPQQVFRKNDWSAALPVLDIDGDGFLDLALGYSLLDSREGVRKSITAKQLDLSMRVFLSRAGQFAKAANFQRDVLIHLDQASIVLGWGRADYFQRYVNLEGDFNGDGKKDLLVRDRRDQMSIYFFVSRNQGFSPRPDVVVSCPEPMDAWQPGDLNNDGITDLVVQLAKGGFRVFISQK